ncbi:MAG TPA: superoxide dismutase [Chitinophagales bacterium]|nr:superoxide dismutase [Chitinophagales bacterium]
MENSSNNSRRSFLIKGTLAALSVSFLNSFRFPAAHAASAPSLAEFNPEGGTFELPKLDYGYDALEPYIDARTMEIHYSKHHQAYVTKLNEALAKAPELKGRALPDLIRNINELPEAVRNAIRNHGGGHFNHSMFWKLMSPTAKDSKASAELEAAINAKWTSMDNFKTEFSKSASTVFGSGWAWLIVDKENNLAITTTPNQDNPIMDVAALRGRPILGIDVWEHAYYLKHQNKRVDYIADFLNVIDWNQVSKWYGER